MAKGTLNTTKYQEEMRKNNVHKTYLARVSGKFKEESFEIDAPLFCVSEKQGKHGVALLPEEVEKSKPSFTKFEVIWYDEISDTSLVKCMPLTGRTHQIRLHLQHIGHSIINDVNYGGRRVGNKRLDLIRGMYPQEWEETRRVLGKRSLDNGSNGKDYGEGLDDNGLEIEEKGGENKGKKVLIVASPSRLTGGEIAVKPLETEIKEGTTSIELSKENVEGVMEADLPELPTDLKKASLKAIINDDEDDMEMKMFFNYGDGDELAYTPFNEERMMEIWLHSSQYTILGKTLKTKDPYWTKKDILHPNYKPSTLNDL